MNFVLQEWSNRGTNLWSIAEEGYPDICIPMRPGVSTYDIPRDTVNLLDSYIRIFTPSAQTFETGLPLIPLTTNIQGPTITNPPANLGNPLLAMTTNIQGPITNPPTNLGNPLLAMFTQGGIPIVAQPIGDPVIAQPASGTLSCVVGSPIITLNWPSPAVPITIGTILTWGCAISIGGLVISGHSTVTGLTGGIQFSAGVAARETQTGEGATPLFWTASGSTSIGVILPGHGLSVGSTFLVPIPTVVGGITLAGIYTVGAVTSSYEFFFTNVLPAISDDAEFENHGLINVSSTYTYQIIARPLVAQPIGDPVIAQPASGTLSCVVGSPVITLNWPSPPMPIMIGTTLVWGCPISIGGLVISGRSTVTGLTGGIQFSAGVAARETQTGEGATPLFWTTAGSPSVGCVLPGHGLSAGQTFSVSIPTAVGGITLAGIYTVGAVTSSYEFFFSVGTPAAIYLFSDSGVPLLSDSGIPLIADWHGTGAPTSDDAEFENHGQINVASTYIENIIGQPLVAQPYGDPLVQQPGNTMSVEAGSQYVTFRWPAHCLIPGSPIFWMVPISIGGISVFGFSVVVEVLDWQTVTFMLPVPALETQTNSGVTPLFWTSEQSPLVGVILPGHGLCQNEVFNVAVKTTLGKPRPGIDAVPTVYLLTDDGQIVLADDGTPIIIRQGTPGLAGVSSLSLFGDYPVASVLNSYTFFINPTGRPVTLLLTDSGVPLLTDGGIPYIADGGSGFAADAQFENSGGMLVATQQTGRQWTDIFLWPQSRNDYAFQPNKEAEGRPTTFWFNRAIYPTITVWPVPPRPQQPSGFKLEPPLAFPQPPSPLGPGPFFAFIGYRMRELEDANPMSGQGLDAPRRFYPVFVAELCQALSEKYKPEVYQQKMQIAIVLWDKASTEDREKLEWAIQPDFASFER